MKWTQASHYHITTPDGRYSVSRSWCGVRECWSYNGWYIRRNRLGERIGMAEQIAAGAKQACVDACEDHAAEQQGISR